MQSNSKRFLAALLLAAMMLSLFAGCQTITPELNHTHGSTGSTVQVPGSTGTNPTTGTTKPTESTPGTDVTVPVTQPTDPTQPSTQPTDPTQPTTQPTDPTQPTTQPTDPTQPTTQPTDPTQPTGCAHSWSDWTVQKEAGCETDGTKIRICQLCSNAQQESIPATGHNWDEGKVTTTPTTCDDVGVKTYTCKTCGQKKVTQITGSHSFGEWEYEEYTYQVKGSFGKVYTYTSHRKVRYCTKCNFKEAVNTENHLCQIGSAVHNVTVEREGTCQVTKVYRSTCTVCGWSTTYDNGEYGKHVVTTETKRLTDYSDYTNELDVTIRTCSVCNGKWYNYDLGKGYERYRMKYQVSCAVGTAYLGQNVEMYTDDKPMHNSTWQFVTRNEKFDSQGYLIQWDYIWHDANGKRYSQTIKMEDIPAMFEAAGYDLSKYEGYSSVNYQLIVDGNRVRPYKIGFA